MSTATCPSQDELHAFSIGLLADEVSDAVAAHLASCAACRAGLSTLDGVEDTFLAQLRRPAVADPYREEAECQAAMARAIALSSPASESRSSQPFRTRALGEYQLIGELGQGGMGTVYKALHTKLDRVVALKVLCRGRAEDRQAISRFEREMRAVGKISHPNVVQAHDAREIEGMPVLVMEFVDGLDLAELVRRGTPRAERDEYGAIRSAGRLPVAEACELVRQTALALQCAHEHGLVHRDVKPSNIMLSRSGEVKLLDLGLARFYAEDGAGASALSAGEEMTGTGQAMGTADYMAPEQAADSRTVDIRADLYSLGCTLYKLLSGRAPFSGPAYRSTLDKLNAHVHQPAPPVQQFAPGVPAELSRILDRLLAKNPDDRFATPADVAEALEPFCRGANLAELVARAFDADLSPLPPREDRRDGEDQGEENPVGQRAPTVKPPLLLTAWGWKWFAGQLILLMMAGGLGFALGIMIRIHKDGKETAIEVPEGSKNAHHRRRPT